MKSLFAAVLVVLVATFTVLADSADYAEIDGLDLKTLKIRRKNFGPSGKTHKFQ